MSRTVIAGCCVAVGFVAVVAGCALAVAPWLALLVGGALLIGAGLLIEEPQAPRGPRQRPTATVGPVTAQRSDRP